MTIFSKFIYEFRPFKSSIKYSFAHEYLWYYQTGVKSPNLPSVSFTSPGFLGFAMIQDVVWIDFSISDFKIPIYGIASIQISKGSCKF